MVARFIVHRHSTGKTHFDLRLVQDQQLRCWSLLREPPLRDGQHRLAIERETFRPGDMNYRVFEEEAFGKGRVHTWDQGTVDITSATPRHLILIFDGTKLSGAYELRRMRWYPGNRWLLEKVRSPHPGAG
jgi:bifunctional non-homologous end joining protein LigD